MDELQTILIIILSVGFGILLIVTIALAIVALRIVLNIRRITQRLDETSENMTELLKYVGKKTAPAALSALGQVLMRKAKSKVNPKKRDKDED